MTRTTSLSDEWIRLFQESESPPHVTVFLTDVPEATLEEICSVLLIDQQFRWSAEPGPRVEEYLQYFPVLAQHEELLIDLVYGEARARAKLGFRVDGDQYRRRFPSVAESLLKQLEVADWLGEPSIPVRLPPQRHPPAVATGTSRRFGNYELIEQIARGGMGIVYKARQDTPRRIIALKMLSPERILSAEDVQRFKNEAIAVSQLEHPGILPIFDVGESEGIPYFTTRLIEHGTLSDQVEELCRQPVRAVEIVRCMASAIHHAHERGVLHRDIKPSNVLVDDEGRTYVTDFGLAKLVHESGDLTHSGDMLGTPAWISPEQAEGKSGGATVFSDVYGIGAVLYFLLTGRPPFEGNGPMDVLTKVRESEPKPPSLVNPEVSGDLNMICQKAMDKDPSRRYSSAEALQRDLECFVQGIPVSARPLPWLELQKRQIYRHPVLTAVFLVLSLAGTAILCLTAMYTVSENRLNVALIGLVRDAKDANAQAVRLKTEAIRTRAEADRLKGDAAVARDEAILARDTHNQLLYAAHMQSAATAFTLSDPGKTDQGLRECIADPREPDQRGFEWFWLKRQVDVPVSETDSGMDNPRCMSYSPDGRFLSIGDSSGYLAIFDTEIKHRRQALWNSSHDMVRSVSFSPSSSLLAAGGDDGTVSLWTPANGDPVHRFRMQGNSTRACFVDDIHLIAADGSDMLFLIDVSQKLVTEIPGGLGKVFDIAAYPEEGLYAAIGENGVGLWELDSAIRKCFIPATKVPIHQWLHFSPNGRQITFRSEKLAMQVWSLGVDGSSRLLADEDFLDEPWNAAFSPRGDCFAVCDRTGGLHTWSLDESLHDTELRPHNALRWRTHEARVNAIAFSTTGHEIVSASKDGILRFWQPKRMEPVSTLSNETFPFGYLTELSFAPDSNLLAAGSDRGVQLWNTSTNSRTSIGTEGQRRDLVTISPDGRYLASGNDGDAIVELWEDAADSNKPKWRREKQLCDQLVFSLDCRLLTVVDWKNDEVVILNSETGELVTKLSSPQCRDASFAPDGLHLAVGQLDDVQIWDCSTWTRHRLLQGSLNTITSVAYSPDGKWIAAGSNDRTIRLWNAVTGQHVHRMLGHRSRVLGFVFSPDGKSLVSLSIDSSIKVWHVATGQFLCDLLTDTTVIPMQIAFSPNGELLAVRLDNGKILLFDTSRSVRPTG